MQTGNCKEMNAPGCTEILELIRRNTASVSGQDGLVKSHDPFIRRVCKKIVDFFARSFR